MVIYYTTEETERGAFLKRVLQTVGASAHVAYAPSGKPYLEAGEPEFNLTDTDGLVAVAVGTQKVGLDAERRKPRRLDALLSRLTDAEREEDFFELWTAKEAYVKYLGGTLAHFLPRLEYKKGVLFYKDAPVDIHLQHFELEGCTVCLCTAGDAPFTLVRL